MSKILFKCPAMPVTPDPADPNGKDKLTTLIECPFTITFDDGSTFDGSVWFPVTKIKHVGWLRYLVDQCTADGNGVGWLASVTLRPEKCLGPCAEPVPAFGAFTCHLGAGTFTGTWPGVFSIPELDGDVEVLPVEAEFDVVMTDRSVCNVPPRGWWCSRPRGHEGPCAARPRWWFKVCVWLSKWL